MKKKRIGEIVDIRKGQKIIEIENGEYNYISIENLHSKAYSNKTNCKGIKCDKDDILIAWDGANAGLTGVGFEGMIGSTLAKMSLKPDCVERVYPKYLYRYLDSKFDYIKLKRTGATIPHVNGNHLRNIEIPLPPLSQQKAIAAQLDKAQELVKYNEQLIEKYDELQQSLFLDMFGDPVINEKGWEKTTITNLVTKSQHSIKRGPFGGALKKEIFVDDGYLVYEQYHALNKDFSMMRYFITDEKFEELKAFEVKPGDIIISCSGVYLGKLAIIPKNARKGIINQALLKITLDNEIMRNDFFVFHFSNSNFKNKYFKANRGAGIPNFPPMTEFRKFPFILPPLDLQNDFAQKIESIEIQKEQAKEALAKSKDIFQGLLQEHFF